jgi:hypothetical protein
MMAQNPRLETTDASIALAQDWRTPPMDILQGESADVFLLAMLRSRTNSRLQRWAYALSERQANPVQLFQLTGTSVPESGLMDNAPARHESSSLEY